MNHASCSLKNVIKETNDIVDKEIISSVLDITGWNRRKASKILKINYKTLLNKISYLDIKQYQVLWSNNILWLRLRFEIFNSKLVQSAMDEKFLKPNLFKSQEISCQPSYMLLIFIWTLPQVYRTMTMRPSLKTSEGPLSRCCLGTMSCSE